MKVVENVIDREVVLVVVKIASFEQGNSWTLAENVRDGFLLMSTDEAFFVFALFMLLRCSLRPQCPFIRWIPSQIYLPLYNSLTLQKGNTLSNIIITDFILTDTCFHGHNYSRSAVSGKFFCKEQFSP